MNSLLAAIKAKIQSLLATLRSWLPVAVGVAVGYLAHPLITLALKALWSGIKSIL